MRRQHQTAGDCGGTSSMKKNASEAIPPLAIPPERQRDIEIALDSVKMHQEELWEALTDLEHLLDDKVELDANTDYSGYDVDTLLEMAEEAEDEPVDPADVMQGPDAPPTMEQIRNEEGM